MRPILIAFCMLAGAVQARDCTPLALSDIEIRGLRAFSDCVIAEIEDLRRENADLRREMRELERSLADIPGELQNRDGRLTRRGGERLAQASFAVTARNREGVSALGIDQAALEELCEAGCLISMALVAEGLRQADPAPAFALGPCAFRYEAGSGVWALSDACGEPVSGIDGDGTPGGTSGGEVIAEVGGACGLADSEPSRGMGTETGTLGQDRTKGLFLIADAALWRDSEDRFRCELKITR